MFNTLTGQDTIDNEQQASLLRWIEDNRILDMALSGNLDQSVYVDRLRSLMSFIGGSMTKQQIARIWHSRKARVAMAQDNINQ